MKPRSLFCRCTSGLLLCTFTFVFIVQDYAFASHPGSSSLSAGSAPSPASSNIESFQPDLLTGRATLSYPIIVPPGRRGLQPSLRITYSSSGSNGSLGVGWSLEMAHIERSTKQGVPRYDDTDIFQLSFQGVTTELVSIGSGEFQAKDEQLFLKVKFNGYDQWTVRDKAGTLYQFVVGQTDGAGRVFTWELKEVRDLLGNTLTCDYVSSRGARYLSEIRYTGNAVTQEPPLNQVKFSYFIAGSSSDEIVNFRSGSQVTIDKRLEGIRTYAQGKVARVYRLRYTKSALTGRYLLASITDEGAYGTTNLPVTRFSYQSDTEPSYSICSNTANQGRAAWNVRKANVDAGDSNFGCVHPYSGLPWSSPVLVEGSADLGCLSVTGDSNASIQISGCKDHFGHAYTAVYVSSAKTISLNKWGSWDVGCLYVEDSGGVRGPIDPASVNLNTGWSILHLVGYHQHSDFSLGFTNSLKNQVDLINPTPFIQPSLLGDFDGNGITDLAVFDPATGTWKVSTAQTCAVRPESVWASGFGSSGSIPLVGDWDGDGRTDIAIYSNGTWRFARSMGLDFQADAWPSLSFGSGTPLIGDFNGDGRTDIGTYHNSGGPNDGKWRVALQQNGAFIPTDSFNLFWAGLGWEPLTGDFNGDGLTDIGTVYTSSGNVAVRLSTGTSFKTSLFYIAGFGANQPHTSADFNGDGLSDVAYYDSSTGQVNYALSIGTTFAPSRTLPVTFSLRGPGTQLQVGDLNGDGLSDPAIFNSVTGAAEMAHSIGTTPDLLRQIVNPLGGTTTLLYQPSSQSENQFLPFIVPVIRQVALQDGLGWSSTTTYLYKGGLYDASSKEFRGFAQVSVIDPGQNQAVSRFHQDTHLKGRPFEQEARDSSGNLYTKTLSTWACSDLSGGAHFCYLVSQEAFTYDGDETFKQTRARFEYDAYGNLTRTVEEGDTSVVGDERTTVTEYRYHPFKWIMSKPKKVQLLDSVGQVVSQRSFVYDDQGLMGFLSTKGLLKEEIQWLDLNALVQNQPTTRFTYDTYGNLATVTDPLGRTTTNSYDTVSHTFLETVANALGHTVRHTYDPRSGLITATTDPNNQTTRFKYDFLGRITTVIGSLDSDTLPGVTYSYDLSQFPFRTTKRVRERAGESAMITSYVFTDGFGRVVQVRTPAEKFGQQVVSGPVSFNALGQVVRQWLPYLDPFSDTYRPPSSALAQVTYAYDALGRLVETKDPDGSTWRSQSQDWTVTKIDANGHKTVHLLDAYARLIQAEEYNGTAVYATYYTYDARGNLLQVKDHSGNITQIRYDLLNRKVEMIDPDMGRWTYAYDTVGNLKTQTDNRGVKIEFFYDTLNQLRSKFYTTPPGSGIPAPPTVWYHYDGSALYDVEVPPGTQLGRLSVILDGTGASEFVYDKLGRLIKETKTIDGTKHTIRRSYDLMGRVISITYPDGEAITYRYNRQGGVDSITGSLPYVTNADYNAASQLTKLSFGNGVTTSYTYHPQTLRVQNIKTTSPTGILQDLTYTFNPVGNLAQLQDWVHSATQSFVYDDLNRLIRATGAYGNFTYEYNPLGNLTFKEGATLTYGLPGGTKPHAVTRCALGATNFDLAYDSNGNLIQKGQDRFQYDAENHLTEVIRTGVTTQFVYDGDGGRVKLITPEGATTFLGQLYEVTASKATKHIFLSSTRVASVTKDLTQLAQAKPKTLLASLKRFFQNVESLFVGTAYAAPGTNTFFYHSDHLGSTNVATDATGAKVELSEFTPFGNFSRHEGSRNSPHQFTGQRLDNTTGLYHYQARYYDPELGRFITPDTIVPNPSDPQDLNRYTYAKNSPLIYTDPTGHFPWFILIGIAIGAGVGAYSAAQAGGNVLVGALFGAVTGAAFGAAAGWAATGLQAAFAAGTITTVESIMIGAAVGTIGGFGTGLISGFAGGAGNLGTMGMGALRGAGLGALSGGVFGGLSPFVPDVLAAAAGGAASGAAAGGDPLLGAAMGGVGYMVIFAAMAIMANWGTGSVPSAGSSIKDPIAVRPATRPVKPFGLRIPGLTRAHAFLADTSGEPIVDMGDQGKLIALNRYGVPGGIKAPVTARLTGEAINAGDVSYGAVRIVSQRALSVAINKYEDTFGGRYNVFSHNSNFSIRYILNEAGGGTFYGELGFNPSFAYDYDFD